MKKLTYILVIFTGVLFFGLTVFYKASATDIENDKQKDTHLNILALTKTQAQMIKLLSGDKHNVTYLFDKESDIDKFSESDKNKEEIKDIDLFMFNGLINEDKVKILIDKSKKSDSTFIDISRGIRPLSTELDIKNKENPYYLLAFEQYKTALYNIKTALEDKDIKNRAYYNEKYDGILTDLKTYFEEKREDFKQYKDYIIISDTDKFDYLLNDINVKTIKFKSDDTEDIIKYIDNIKEKNDKTKIIFIYDKNSTDLNKLKNDLKIELVYLDLDESISDDKENLLIKNTDKLLGAIKK